MSDQTKREGLAIQHLRESKGWKQEEFVREVFSDGSVNKNVLSNIERGLTRLGTERREKIERYFAVSLESAIQEMESTGAIRLMKGVEYFETLSKFLDKGFGPDGASQIWFWHPLEAFPILNDYDQTARNQWIKNLQAGVTINLVWPLPVCSEAALASYRLQASTVLAETAKAKATGEGTGQIKFWGLGLKTESQEIRNAFYRNLQDAFSQNLKAPGKMTFERLILLDEAPELFDVLIYDGLVLAQRADGQSYGASFHESRKSLDPASVPVVGWLNLGLRTLGKLEVLARSIIEISKRQNPDGNSVRNSGSISS